MRTYLKRLGEQVLVVFGAAFIPVYVLGDQSTLKAAALAGAAAVVKLVYGLLVKRIGDYDSPSVL